MPLSDPAVQSGKGSADRAFLWPDAVDFVSTLYIATVFALIVRDAALRFAGANIPGFDTIAFAGFASLAIMGTRSGIRWIPSHFALFVGLAGFSAANALAVGLEPSRFLAGWYKTFLPMMAFVLFLNLPIRRSSFRRNLEIFSYLLTMLLLIGLAEGILLSGNPAIKIMSYTNSLFRYPSYQSAWAVILVAIALYLRKSGGGKRFIAIATFAMLCLFLIAFRKSIVGGLFTFSLFLLYDGTLRQRLQRLVVLASGVTLYMTFFGSFILGRMRNLGVYVAANSGDSIARTALHIKSFEIARDYFPWGSGMGTFASEPAAVHYSPLYYKYGLSTIVGLEPFAGTGGSPTFLLDTYWPHILAEFGFLGSILFLVLWSYPVVLAFRRRKQGRDGEATFLLILSLHIALFLESLGATYIEQMQYIFVYAGLSAIALTLSQQGSET